MDVKESWVMYSKSFPSCQMPQRCVSHSPNCTVTRRVVQWHTVLNILLNYLHDIMFLSPIRLTQISVDRGLTEYKSNLLNRNGWICCTLYLRETVKILFSLSALTPPLLQSGDPISTATPLAVVWSNNFHFSRPSPVLFFV